LSIRACSVLFPIPHPLVRISLADLAVVRWLLIERGVSLLVISHPLALPIHALPFIFPFTNFPRPHSRDCAALRVRCISRKVHKDCSLFLVALCPPLNFIPSPFPSFLFQTKPFSSVVPVPRKIPISSFWNPFALSFLFQIYPMFPFADPLEPFLF